MAALVSRLLLEGWSMNQRALRKLSVSASGRTWLSGEVASLMAFVLGTAQEDKRQPGTWIYSAGLERACESTGLNKANVSSGLKRACEVGVLRLRGLESHEGYYPTKTYEVNVDLVTGGVGELTNPPSSRVSASGGRDRRHRGGRDRRQEGWQEGWQVNEENPSAATSTSRNLNPNGNSNSNREVFSPNTRRIPENLCGAELNEWLEGHVLCVLLHEEAKKTPVANFQAWSTKLARKYRPLIAELVPKRRDALERDLFHASRSIVDRVTGLG